jgi:hypothetical protein
MLRNLKTSVVLTLMGMVASSIAGDSRALPDEIEGKTRGKGRAATAGRESFSTNGMFSGSLAGQITVGDRTVVITDRTTVYIAGDGVAEKGTFVANRPVHVGGMVENGVLVASFVVVRPVDSRGKTLSMTKVNGWVASDSDPTLGSMPQDAHAR